MTSIEILKTDLTNRITDISKLWCLLLICITLVITFIIVTNPNLSKEFYFVHKHKVENQTTLADQLKCSNLELKMEIIRHNSYWLLQNLVRGSVSQKIGCADSITYATHGDYMSIALLELLVQKWRAPISFAAYAPGTDLNYTINSIQYVRNCLRKSKLIAEFVTFHVYFPAAHMPLFIPHSEQDILDLPFSCNMSAYEGTYQNQQLYRNRHNMTYPENVGRNIARKASNTYFVLTSEMTLLPSLGIVQKFLQMAKRNTSLVVPGAGQKPRVFPLYTFELDDRTKKIPNNKKDLMSLIISKKAIPYHAMVCRNCHRMPYYHEYLQLGQRNEISLMNVTKRHGTFAIWEPFFISDNKEPLYDERLYAEGKSTKRVQHFAMCLLDYEYYALTDEFLQQIGNTWKRKENNTSYRSKANKLIYQTIVPEYRKMYGYRNECGV